MSFRDGYIPDIVQAKNAHAVGSISDREAVLNLAAPWDVDGVPPVTSWESFQGFLEGHTFDAKTHWWSTLENVEDYFTPSQQSRPNCAGFALANATTMRLINQCKREWSEQKVEKLNPMATWVMSKNGSAWNGQTISGIMLAGNKYGNFPAEIAGVYDQSNNYEEWKKLIPEANKRQVGICLCEGSRSEIVSAIAKACRLGYTVVIGNSVAVHGQTKDSNGVNVAKLGGTWSHATAFGGYMVEGNVIYVFWVNSHGNIYKNFNGEPAFGSWMDLDTLDRFVSSSFCDVAFITYAEAPYDETILPTLNPEECK